MLVASLSARLLNGLECGRQRVADLVRVRRGCVRRVAVLVRVRGVAAVRHRASRRTNLVVHVDSGGAIAHPEVLCSCVAERTDDEGQVGGAAALNGYLSTFATAAFLPQGHHRGVDAIEASRVVAPHGIELLPHVRHQLALVVVHVSDQIGFHLLQLVEEVPLAGIAEAILFRAFDRDRCPRRRRGGAGRGHLSVNRCLGLGRSRNHLRRAIAIGESEAGHGRHSGDDCQTREHVLH